MRGSLRQRGEKTWLLILEFGYRRDPQTGKSKRIQKYQTYHGTRKQAEAKLNDLISDVQHDTFIASDKRTVGEWLDSWVDLAIKPPMRTQQAYQTYKSVIALHLKPALGDLRLQGLRVLDVEKFLADKAEKKLAPATLEKIFTVLSSALKAAVRSGLVARNVASAVSNKPHAPEGHSEAVSNCWSADDAAAFLRVARKAGAQPAAFFALALDSGMRKSELAGLQWSDVDLAQGRVLVQQQLLTGGSEPTFTPPKGKRARTIEVAAETVELLKNHKVQQSAIKMRHRRDYADHGLVFAKPWTEMCSLSVLGHPLQINNLGEREFAALVTAAGVPSISLHGLRHTCASLLLAAGVPSRVVQERLGHKKIETTLAVYAHVLPGQQRDAARRLAQLLHGTGS